MTMLIDYYISKLFTGYFNFRYANMKILFRMTKEIEAEF